MIDPMAELFGSNTQAGPDPRAAAIERLMQLAGDVVPMPRGREDAARIENRFRQTDAPFNMYGNQTIQGMGGRQSPYLDLMDVLQFPSGQPYPRR